MKTTSWILALGLSLSTAGCAGDGTPGGDDTSGGADARNGGPSGVNQSGSRIKMTVLTTPDGAKAFTGWRDTELDLDCNFQLAADGAMRCLPVTDAFQFGDTNFGDAACTIPVATRSGCAGTEPRHILRYPDQTCPAGGFRVFQAGTKYTAVYVRTGGSCVPVTPSPTVSYYAVGAELDPSTFQSATSTVE